MVAAFVLAAPPAAAQVDRGEISGLALDASGAALPGAEIRIADRASGVVFNSQTAENGKFIVPNLPIGYYDVTVRADGFKERIQQGVKVDAAGRTSLTIELEIGALTETVEVTASSVLLQSETARMGGIIEARQISDLALNGRNPLNLALMKAGVVGGNFNQFNPGSLGASSFNINGGDSQGNAVTLDGVNAIRTRSGTAAR